MDYYLSDNTTRVLVLSKVASLACSERELAATRFLFNSFFARHFVEAAKLSSYMHFREPFRLQKKTLLEKADLDKAIDFMDVIEEDIPKGEQNSFRIRVIFSCIENSQRC